MTQSLRDGLEPLREFPLRLEQVESLDQVVGPVDDVVKGVLTPGSPLNEVLSGTALGHPIHPLLTDAVIGSWTSAVALDLVGGKRSRRAADRLIALGVCAALPTAATGVNDWTTLFGSTRRVGVVHGAGNLVATALFGTSWLARKAGRRVLGKALALAGLSAVSAGSFLGGHLSYRRGVGVDHTAFLEAPGDWTEVAEEANVKESEPTLVEAAGVEIMLVRQDGSLYALLDRCAHQGGPLHEGKIEDGCVICPWHASRYRVSDGVALSGPTSHPQPALQVRRHEGKIEVRR
jgi:nitrite reductase/ring-hydroxylating ferredoxin subunit/uncharacterized membrane protein